MRADSSYLITGGLGGLGLKVAHWLIEEGARHLVLVSRRGATSPAAQKALNQLLQSIPLEEQAAANLLVVKADVAQREEVAQMLAEIAAPTGNSLAPSPPRPPVCEWVPCMYEWAR